MLTGCNGRKNKIFANIAPSINQHNSITPSLSEANWSYFLHRKFVYSGFLWSYVDTWNIWTFGNKIFVRKFTKFKTMPLYLFSVTYLSVRSIDWSKIDKFKIGKNYANTYCERLMMKLVQGNQNCSMIQITNYIFIINRSTNQKSEIKNQPTVISTFRWSNTRKFYALLGIFGNISNSSSQLIVFSYKSEQSTTRHTTLMLYRLDAGGFKLMDRQDYKSILGYYMSFRAYQSSYLQRLRASTTQSRWNAMEGMQLTLKGDQTDDVGYALELELGNYYSLKESPEQAGTSISQLDQAVEQAGIDGVVLTDLQLCNEV